VNDLYQAFLRYAPDQAGWDFWTGQVGSKWQNRQGVMEAFIGAGLLQDRSRQCITGNIRALLDLGADVNRANEFGDTAVSLAAGWDTVTLTQLLQKKANPNINRKDGETALTIASRLGHDEAVRILLAGSADPDKKNAGGKAALMLAEEELRFNKSMNVAVRRRLSRITILLRQASRIGSNSPSR
jgi:ankyrin repeat protein